MPEEAPVTIANGLSIVASHRRATTGKSAPAPRASVASESAIESDESSIALVSTAIPASEHVAYQRAPWDSHLSKRRLDQQSSSAISFCALGEHVTVVEWTSVLTDCRACIDRHVRSDVARRR